MEDYDTAYKDLSELKAELEGLKAKKDISAKDLAESVQKLTVAISEMLEVFGAAAEQMNLEEKEYESNVKKHEAITQKLDKIIDQNRTIAEGLVAIVEMVKEKVIEAKEMNREAPRPEPKPFFPRPQARPEPRPEPRMMPPIAQAPPPIPPPSPNPIPGTMLSGGPKPAMPMQPITAQAGMPDFGDLPPPPSGDLNFDDFKDLDLESEPKKKGFFGFKK
jgi:hypothetical protein